LSWSCEQINDAITSIFCAEPWLKSALLAGWKASALPRSAAGANLIVGLLQLPRSLAPEAEEAAWLLDDAAAAELEAEPEADAALPLLAEEEDDDPAFAFPLAAEDPAAAPLLPEALPDAALPPADALPTAVSTPILEAVTPRALLKSVAAVGSPLRPLMAA
jgi:hypothetical protein